MWRGHFARRLGTYAGACLALFLPALHAAELKGKVEFGGLPLPGATVTATQGDKTLRAVADGDGQYLFADIAPGDWNFQVEMLCFVPAKQQVTVAASAAGPDFELKMMPLDEIKSFAAIALPQEPPRISVTTQNTPPAATDNSKNAKNTKNAKNQKAANGPAPNAQASFQRTAVNANADAAPPADAAPAANSAFGGQSTSDLSQRAADGVLINGSVNNGASTPFAQAARFGNNVRGPGSLYNGGLALSVDTSAVDARTYSFTGQDTAKPTATKLTGQFNIGGPIRIPHFIRNGPQFFVNYTWQRNRTSNATAGLMPTDAQRNGDFSAFAPVYDPLTGAPFSGNQIPASRFSPQAQALLKYYPEPNFTGSTLYNYQVPIVTPMHSDGLQSRLNKNIGNKNQLYGNFAFQRIATDNQNLFEFIDRTHSLGLTGSVNWQHRISQRMFIHLQATYSRQSTATTPNFANKENVSQEAGILGNNQDPRNWGPPALQFSGITPLSEGNFADNHNQTIQYTFDSLWNRGRHEINYGADFKRLQFNQISQSNPRGSFSFTGALTAPPGSTQPLGNDFADFLLGTPDTSQIAFGNADKYFRESQWDGFVTDNWRVGPALTLMLAVRYDYQAPVTELYGRLVNLDIAPGFSGAEPVSPVLSNLAGPLSGQKYGNSLIQPDRTEFQPRLGFAWRPIPASSLVVRGSYNVGYNTSVYQTLAALMAQQSPLSKSLIVQNSAANPLTLANGFNAPAGQLTDTYAIDPHFRVGYAQTFQLSVQRDLPGSLVATATYLGIKGTRGQQEFVPNTYPTAAVNPCPLCPTGFYYFASNGNSIRHSAQLQLRRRLHNGLTANLSYTFAKSIDDSALGGRGSGTSVIAQNWLDLSAERGLSTFDQRHLLAFQLQYTTGQGIGGGGLLSGWRATAFHEWTLVSTVNAGTGFPLSPSVFSALARTGVTGAVRPDYTGAPLYDAPPGLFLNPAAYVLPASGEWGNAGRDTITGPSQFTLNASLRRSFRLKDRYSLDVNVDANNLLNHVNYTSWNTLVNGPQFGVASGASAMRNLVTTLRVRF
jgi:outer membrane receptor protein involved in Fe transport